MRSFQHPSKEKDNLKLIVGKALQTAVHNHSIRRVNTLKRKRQSLREIEDGTGK